MTDTEQPSQWAVKEIETVTGDFLTELGAPFYRIEIDGYCADFDYREAAENFASAIQRAFAEREAELVGKMRSIMAHFDCDRGDAPGHGHLAPGIWDKDAGNGVMGGTECGWCAEWNDMRAALKSREAGHG